MSIASLRRRALRPALARRAAPLALAGGLAAACVQVPPKGGFEEVAALAAERGAPAVWSADAPEQDEMLRRTAPLLAGELGVEQAVEVALLRSPSLQAGFETLGVAQADLVQAGLPANPVLSASAMPGLSGDLGTQQLYDLTQNLLQLLALPARKDLAAREFAATRLRVASEVTALAALVRAGYFELAAAQNLLATLRAIDATEEAAEGYAARLYEAGNLSERELASRRALREETRLAVLEAEAGASEARARLARALAAQPGEDAWRVPERLPGLPAADPDLAALEVEAPERRLDVLAAAASVDALGRALAIARRWRWLPLLEVGIGSERQPEGGWNLGPSLSLALPLFDQGQAGRARLEATLRAEARALEAARLDARSDVREAAARLRGSRARAERLRDATIPLRERLVELTLEQHRFMLVGAFDLLLAKRDEIAAYRDYLDALRDYWIAFAALEGAAGRRIEAAAAAPAPARERVPAEKGAPDEPHEHHHHEDM